MPYDHEETYKVGEVEVVVKDLTGFAESHVWLGGVKFEVWHDDKGPSGAGWYTQVGTDEVGPWQTAQECIDRQFLDTAAWPVQAPEYKREKPPEYESEVTHTVGESTVVVKKIIGHDEYRVVVDGDEDGRFEVWFDEEAAAGPGWYTEVGSVEEGPYPTAEELLEELFLSPEL